MVDPISNTCDQRNLPSEEESKNNDHGSRNKWMSSKQKCTFENRVTKKKHSYGSYHKTNMNLT